MATSIQSRDSQPLVGEQPLEHMPTEEEQEQPAAQGGKRPGSGRPPGAKNKKKYTAAAPEEEGEFWEWLSKFSPDQWQQMICYVWRVYPVLDRRGGGAATHIQKYIGAFDLEKIMLDHGSGRYRFDVCRVASTGNGSNRIRQHYETIINIQHPPNIPPGDWLLDPANKNWTWAKGQIDAAQAQRDVQAKAIEENPSAASVADPNQIFNTVLAGIEKLRGTQGPENVSMAAAMMQMVVQSQDRMMALQDPSKQLETIKSMLTLAQPAAGASSEGALIVTMLRDELRETRAELRELRNKENKSLIDQLRDVGPVLQDLTGLFGYKKINGASGRTDWAEVASKAVDKLADSLPALASAFLARAPAARSSFQQRRQAAAAAAGPGAATAPTAAPGPAGSKHEQRLQWIIQTYGPLIEQVAPYMLDHFANYGGLAFRDWFVHHYGIVMWRELNTEAGAQTLTEIAQLHDGLREQLAPREKLQKFLEEFFREEEAEEDEAAAAGAGDGHATA